MKRLVSCLFFAGSLGLGNSGGSRSVKSVEYNSLFGQDVESRLRETLMTEGLIAVTGIPGLAQARADALSSSVGCIAATQDKLQVTLDDGTVRSSLGTQSFHGTLGALPSLADTNACKAFGKSSKTLRRAVQLTSQLFVKSLDSVLSANVSGTILDGEALEHFHVYSAGTPKVSSHNALDLHTDAGMFIAFVPAVLVQQDAIDSNGSGFMMETPDGQVVEALFPDGGDAVVFMTGDGFNQVFGKQSQVPLRPVPHMLRIPGLVGSRAWYGKMFLPPRDTLVSGNRLFDSVRKEQIEAASRGAVLSQVGCSSTELMAKDLGHGCSAGEVYCWMQCMSAPPCPGGGEAKCLHKDGSIWTDKDGHCTSCSPRCVNEELKGFCNGVGASMYMQGFTGAGDPGDACLVLLFTAFKLDSPLKYAAGVLGVFLFGVSVEFLVSLRRKVEAKARAGKKNMWTTFVRLSLMGVQLVAAYLAMLVAMTYSVYMFVSVILGLVVGHGMFNLSQPVAKFAEPCCAALDDDEDDDAGREQPLLSSTN